MQLAIRSPGHRAFDESPNTLRLVEAARRTFLRSGGVGFGVRSVAREAAMSVGAVQHYYRTRDELLVAMLEYVIDGYGRAYERMFSNLPFNAEERLMRTLDYLAGDSCNPQSRQFFFALFSVSSHNRFVATLVDEVFLRYRRNLAALIAAARPTFSETRCFEAATQIVGMLEGLAVFTGRHMQHSLDRATMTRLVRMAVAKLLCNEPAKASVAARGRARVRAASGG